MYHINSKRKGFLIALTLTTLLAVVLGPGLAEGEVEGEFIPEEELSIEAAVRNSFTYQGILRENGTPVNGTVNMVFRLYSNSICSTPISGIITKNNLPVSNGLVNTDLPFSHSYFNSQELWLGISVDGTMIGCQEILPVPYALSLSAGAIIEGTRDHLLVVDNTSTLASDIDSLIVRNDSGGGEAVEVAAVNNAVAAFATNGIGVWGDSDNNYGVYGHTLSTTSAGVLAKGVDNGADLILGGNADTTAGDNGIIKSDPSYPSSDIVLITNDNIRIDLNNDVSSETAEFEIYYNGSRVFQVDESGNVNSGGSGLVAFPKPAYDSGWQTLSAGSCQTLTHSLGGNAEKYFVDMTFQKTTGTPMGLNNSGIGGDNNGDTARGGSWQNLTNSTIDICRWYADVSTHQIRVRIWIYP